MFFLWYLHLKNFSNYLCLLFKIVVDAIINLNKTYFFERTTTVTNLYCFDLIFISMVTLNLYSEFSEKSRWS